jgi:hypothetical protein
MEQVCGLPVKPGAPVASEIPFWVYRLLTILRQPLL